jgi:hypothetical protein
MAYTARTCDWSYDMADANKTAAPAGKPPIVPTKPPVVPANGTDPTKVEPAGDEPVAKGKVKYQEVFPTEAEAVAEMAKREKGPRRAFTCLLNGKTTYVVANNEGRAGGVAFAEAGGVVTEIGKAPKAAKIATADGIMAAINALPEEMRASVLAQIDGLKAK